jgi:Xaa-Pro aminopeptidase
MPPPRHEEFHARADRARALLRAAGIDGLIVTDPVSYQYFAGVKLPVQNHFRPAALVLPVQGEPVAIHWSGPAMFARLYHRPSPGWVKDTRIYDDVPRTFEATDDWGIRDALADRGLAGARLAIELGRETRLGLTIHDFERLRAELLGATFVDSGPVVWGCRTIKSDWEIACARKACEIGGTAFARVLAELRPGVSQRDIQRRVLAITAELGADLDSDPPLALGARGPGGTFQKGDALYLDGGPRYQGYRMDFTRRAVFGAPTPRQRDEHDWMWDLLRRLMDRMKPGVATRELFEYSQRELAKRPDFANYSADGTLRIGHGVGLDTEPPYINAFDNSVLAEGMTITPEPKIESADGLVNPEEHVVVRAGGVEILSVNPGSDLVVVA